MRAYIPSFAGPNVPARFPVAEPEDSFTVTPSLAVIEFLIWVLIAALTVVLWYAYVVTLVAAKGSVG